MKGILGLSFLFIFLTQLYSQSINDPAKALPDSIDGWKKLGEDRLFNDTNLYDYIDGAAELYISFGFSKVFNRIYSAGSGKEIVVDIFYMNTSRDAFGAFSFSVGKTGNDFGVQSQISPGAIVFWKNNFVVSIVENPETEESKKIGHKIAHAIDEAIKEKGSYPEILKYLPAENLDVQSIRYFRHYVWLNTYTFLSSENILNINQNVHGVFAKYGDKSKLILMLIKYPGNQEAVIAKEKFRVNYYKGLKKKEVIKAKDGKYNALNVEKNFLYAVFSAANESDAKTIMNRVKETINRFDQQNK